MHGLEVPQDGVPHPEAVGVGERYWAVTASVGTLRVERTARPGGSELPTIGGRGQRIVDWRWREGGLLEGTGFPDEVDDLDPREVWEQDQVAPIRGVIRAWSAKSRNRMTHRLATLDWAEVPGIMEMLTLTYPAAFPVDGEVCKEQLRTFRERYRRRWVCTSDCAADGARCNRHVDAVYASWKFEFQRRGAPHFHLYIARPNGIGWEDFKAWCAENWYEVVGSGDPRHLRAGVGVDRQFCNRAKSARAIAWYFAKHQSHAGEKSYQNDVPAGFQSCGRFWGYWGLKSTEETAPVGERLAVDLIRAMKRYRASSTKADRKLKLKQTANLWVLAYEPVELLARLLAADRGPDYVWVNERTGEVRHWRPGRRRPLP